MTITEAIKTARQRVTIISYGLGQFQVHTYLPERNATWMGNMTNHAMAIATARENKIRIALELMGVEDAGMEANILCQDEGRFEDVVRSFLDFLKEDRQ